MAIRNGHIHMKGKYVNMSLRFRRKDRHKELNAGLGFQGKDGREELNAGLNSICSAAPGEGDGSLKQTGHNVNI